MEIYNLTTPQKSIWFTENSFLNKAVNNICGTLLIKEQVDFKKLEQSINIFLQENDSFRIKLFYDDNNDVKQYIDNIENIDIEICDINSKEELKQLEQKIVKIPFNIIENFLFNIKIFRFSNNQGGFIINAHHLISDARTAGIVVEKIMDIYIGLVKNKTDNINKISTSYVDYIKSENEYLESTTFKKDCIFWENLFSSIPESVPIPSLKSSNSNNCEASRKQFLVSNKTLKTINEFCNKNKISVFNFFMSIYSIYIGNVCNIQDFTIGTPVLNRSTFKEKNTTGMFINTMPFRIFLDNSLTFTQFISKIAKDSLTMFRHQKYPYYNLLEHIRKSIPNQPNLYDILISYQNSKYNKQSFEIPYEVTWNFNGNVPNSLDIHLFDTDVLNKLNIAYDYRLDRYSNQDITNMHNRIIHIIEQVLNNNDILLSEIEVVTLKEKDILLNKFNNTHLEYDENKTIINYFEDQVKKCPNNIALVFNGKKLTYQQLNVKANCLATHLRNNGVTNNNIVGILLNRSIEMIVSILAVLKSGGAYVPIDPEYPYERIKYILKDTKSNILLTNIQLKNKFRELDNYNGIVIYPNSPDIYTEGLNNLINISKPEDLSYLIYTSGSTGMPKGVMLTQKNLTNFYNSMVNKIDYLSNGSCNSIVSITTVSFDIFIFETIVSLACGLKLFLANSDEQKNTSKLEKLIIDNDINILQTTPSIMNFHLNNSTLKGFSKLKYLILAGEQLPKSLVDNIRKLSTKCVIYNGYGPSETTIFSTIKKISLDEDINIGTPIHNTQVYILGNNLNLLPQGVTGEIFIGGLGVGKGFINNSKLNVKKFLTNPFADNSIIYKTGDLGVWLHNGNIQFKGRIDNQVKLRGLRIELQEIEEKINNFDATLNTTSAVIIKNINGNNILCAFIAGEKINVQDLKSYLLCFLPIYMIPNKFIFLESLPYTPNGKIDRAELEKLDVIDKDKRILTSSTLTEKKLFDIISVIVEGTNFSIDDDFFSIGLDSLDIIKLSSKIAIQFNIEVSSSELYSLLNIIELAKFIDMKSTYLCTKKEASMKTSYHLSNAQKRIYSTCKMNNNSILYNISGAIVVNTILDKGKVETAFNKLINDNTSLRTYFKIVDNQPYQFILKHANINIKTFNTKKEDIYNIINNFPKPFNLEKAPLIRLEMHYIDNKQTMILFDSHHIILDGVSLNILINKFCNSYNNQEVKKTKLDYIDYIIWEDSFNSSNKLKQFEKYWSNKFKDREIPSINLPYDFSTSQTKSFSGDKIFDVIPEDIFRNIEDFAKRYNVSKYMLFITVFYLLLFKYTSQENIIIGSPISSRDIKEFQDIIGMFTNNIVLDNTIDPSMTFLAFLKHVKNIVLEAQANQPYSYDMLIKKLKLSNSSIFDVVFTYQDILEHNCKLNDSELEIIFANTETSKFNLTLEVIPATYGLNIEYNTNLFKKETVQSILEHYLHLLRDINNYKDLYLKDIDILTPKENQLLEIFNNTEGEINNDTITSIFENQVIKTPNNIALVCDNKSLTYLELNRKANSLAHYLIKQGVKSNDIVCIMSNRSLETVVSMLAILKSGAAFLNVDPTYPINRTKYYIENSNIKYVLIQRDLINKIDNIENCIQMDLDIEDIYNLNIDNPKIQIDNNDLSYVIYTSGSTGTPKGVLLNQIGLSNMTKAMSLCLDYLKQGEKHTLVSVTSTPFDIFVYEIIVSLTHGLKVIMANNTEHRNPKLLDKLIRRHNVDVMTVTPSLMKINYDNREPDSALSMVKHMVFGGEPLSEKFVQDLRELSQGVTIYNIYGPSEITILSNVQNLNNEKEITVGPPILNTKVHILDKYMNGVPIGVKGEIYVSGIQVGLGYIGNKELTNKKFLQNPFGSGKMYKTGDIGRWTFDGKVQCLGRIDNQVKLRGLRIELGEIENKMENIPQISTAIVNKVEINGQESLCGYFVSNIKISEKEIKDFLRKELPQYMVPTYIIQLDKMPYTINRKIDRKSLPLPNLNKNNSTKSLNIHLVSSKEDKLLEIWKVLLNRSNISIHDDFFNIGGDSLLAIKLQIEALKYGLNFEYADIFNYPTIHELSKKAPNVSNNLITQYDYSKVNKILSRNTLSNISTIKKSNINSIILIGGTGYIGAHIINLFLQNETGMIFCLIRPKNNMNTKERLIENLDFYFGNGFFERFRNRIHIMLGDITKENIGLSKENYCIFRNNIDVVINSGAIVKHFGDRKLFEDINVKGTSNIIDLCIKENKRLLHVSTVSVSGNGEKEKIVLETPENINNKTIFKENNLYINQHINGVYSTTKYMAELLVLEAIDKGLNAQILRIGNVTNRYSDGLFQKNVSENAFATRIKSFVEIGAFPDYLLKHEIELTPVDLCADAIIKILQHESICNVIHLYNTNLLPINLFVNTLKELGIELTAVPNRIMVDIISGILEDNSRKEILSGIIHDLDKDKNLIYTSNIRLNAEFSNKYLNEIGFYWKGLSKDYIIKYINYFKKIGFIKY